MKPMIATLCAVLWCVSVVVAQERDWLSGTWKGVRKPVSSNVPGSDTVLRLHYNPATKVVTGEGNAANRRIANSNFTETVLEGSFFEGDKGVLILKQSGGMTDGAVRKYIMERQGDGSLSGYSDDPKRGFMIQLEKQ